jgi:hypothetical protein
LKIPVIAEKEFIILLWRLGDAEGFANWHPLSFFSGKYITTPRGIGRGGQIESSSGKIGEPTSSPFPLLNWGKSFPNPFPGGKKAPCRFKF